MAAGSAFNFMLSNIKMSNGVTMIPKSIKITKTFSNELLTSQLVSLIFECVFCMSVWSIKLLTEGIFFNFRYDQEP